MNAQEADSKIYDLVLKECQAMNSFFNGPGYYQQIENAKMWLNYAYLLLTGVVVAVIYLHLSPLLSWKVGLAYFPLLLGAGAIWRVIFLGLKVPSMAVRHPLTDPKEALNDYLNYPAESADQKLKIAADDLIWNFKDVNGGLAAEFHSRGKTLRRMSELMQFGFVCCTFSLVLLTLFKLGGLSP